jgi:hypothetical protein
MKETAFLQMVDVLDDAGKLMECLTDMMLGFQSSIRNFYSE